MTHKNGTEPKRQSRTFQTAVDRWASVGPYYAMFPVDFAFEVVQQYTKPGDRVLDPFVGRGSSIYAAGACGREGCGIEINPVGWIYSRVKLRPVTEGRVLKRLREISRISSNVNLAYTKLPEFFDWAYTPDVLRFLLAAREHLRWRQSRVDATLMVFILIYLHGRRSSSLSNQMRDSKAMAPDYSVRWWEKRDMRPPEVEPLSFFEKKIVWRYKKGRPELEGYAYLGDSVYLLNSRRRRKGFDKPFDLLFTSPPYFGVTNYYYDQWLRRWMLGEPPLPYSGGQRWKRKFESQVDFEYLLSSVFESAASKMRENAIVYVRTDARQFTLDTTIKALQKAFPKKALTEISQPINGKSQTALYGDTSKKPGEIDLIMTPR